MRYIIHTAAPVWAEDGEEGAKVARLARCYKSAIALAHERKLRSIAFPCLGTGNFGWPRSLACGVAIAAVEEALGEVQPTTIEQVVFCCFSDTDAEVYLTALA